MPPITSKMAPGAPIVPALIVVSPWPIVPPWPIVAPAIVPPWPIVPAPIIGWPWIDLGRLEVFRRSALHLMSIDTIYTILARRVGLIGCIRFFIISNLFRPELDIDVYVVVRPCNGTDS